MITDSVPNSCHVSSPSDAVLARRDEVFSDVKDEFSDLSSIKNHLEQWKFSFPTSYSQAYLSLCLPKLFSPFVRLELLSWNPLADESVTLEDCQWFQVLMFYGFLEGVEPERDDEDLLLIPRIVEKVVLPKLTGKSDQEFPSTDGSVTLIVRRLAPLTVCNQLVF